MFAQDGIQQGLNGDFDGPQHQGRGFCPLHACGGLGLHFPVRRELDAGHEGHDGFEVEVFLHGEGLYTAGGVTTFDVDAEGRRDGEAVAKSGEFEGAGLGDAHLHVVVLEGGVVVQNTGEGSVEFLFQGGKGDLHRQGDGGNGDFRRGAHKSGLCSLRLQIFGAAAGGRPHQEESHSHQRRGAALEFQKCFHFFRSIVYLLGTHGHLVHKEKRLASGARVPFRQQAGVGEFQVQKSDLFGLLGV